METEQLDQQLTDQDRVLVVFGYLGPLALVPAPRTYAVAIEGEMEVNETGRRVKVLIPLGDDDAMRLLQLLQDLQRTENLPPPKD